jgi:hypothetical protein
MGKRVSATKERKRQLEQVRSAFKTAPSDLYWSAMWIGPTEEEHKAAVNLARKGYPVHVIAAIIGIAPAIMQAWLDRGAQEAERQQYAPLGETYDVKEDESTFFCFFAAMAKAMATCEGAIVDRISAAGASPKLWQANKFLLETRFPKQWAAKKDTEKASEDEGVEPMAISVNFVGPKTHGA